LATRESRRRALCRRFHRLTQSLLGRRVNLHCLRHTSFSRLYAATKDLLLVKEWAGHKSIQSTLVYMTLENLAEANKTQAAILRDLAMK
jgi:integrase